MSLADELEKLERLRESGALSDDEFQAAKRSLLSPAAQPSPAEDQSLGRAANRYVSFQMVMAVVGVIIFLIFLCGVILPGMNRMDSNTNNFPLGDLCEPPNVTCSR